MKPLRGYYAILDVAAGSNRDIDGAVARARRLLAARPCCLQIRAKTASAAELLELGRAVRPLTREASAALCINDRLDIALLIGADAVHLGQEDLQLREARKLVEGVRAVGVAGRHLAIGVSTHNREQAAAAIAEGADYLGYGPIFPTTTKRNPDAVVGLTGLAEICGLGDISVIAIGGLAISHMTQIAGAGAAGAALIAAMDDASDVVRAGCIINAAFGLSAPRAGSALESAG